MDSPFVLTSDLALVDGALTRGFALVLDPQSGRIVAAGPRASVAAGMASARVIDLGRRLLMPGTVNAHNHSFQSLLRGFGDDLPFLEWRAQSLYRLTPRLLQPRGDDPRDRGVYIGALFAFAEMALHGVSTVCDFFYLNEGGNDNARAVIQAAKDVGLRIVLARCFYDYAAAPPAFRETPAQASANFIELHGAFKDDPQVQVCPAPHSLHGASRPMLEAAVAAARAVGTPWHMHLAEESYQVTDCLAAYGLRPVYALESFGVLGPDLVAIHGCWFDEGERALLRERGAALVHCPGSNMFLGDGVADIVDLRRRGLRVALGTDGGCSNSRVSVLDEARSAALLQKVHRCDGQAIDAGSCLAMATSGGGDVLGMPIGRLRPGDGADVLALDLDDPSLWPEQSAAKNVVYAHSPRAITDLFVRGRPVVRDRALCRVSLLEVGARVRELTAGW